MHRITVPVGISIATSVGREIITDAMRMRFKLHQSEELRKEPIEAQTYVIDSCISQ